MNPHAMPNEIESVNIIISMVINTEEVTTKSSQLISFNCVIIRVPTIIKAEVVTGVVNSDRIIGEMKIDKINSMPITILVKPVRDPIPIPVALSIYVVIVLVPNIEPIIPPRALRDNAFSIPSTSPSSLTNPHCLPNEINVPVASNRLIKTSVNNIMIKFGMFENNSPKPLVNPPNNDKSNIVVIAFLGNVGINSSPAPTPNNTMTNPMIAVIIIPMNMADRSCLRYRTKVIKIPITARNTGGENKFPNVRNVVGCVSIIPEDESPMNAS